MDPDPQEFLFPPFRLDLTNACLWRGEQRIALRPTPFSILHYLLQHPGRLTTKEELLEAIWPDAYVSATVLKGYIQQIRKALGDNPREPRFIETVQRRGYRWVGDVKNQKPVLSRVEGAKGKSQNWEGEVQGSKFKIQSPPLIPNSGSLTPPLVGRETELGHLHSWFELARRGTRQIVFVTGEAGIGKTAVIDFFSNRSPSKTLVLTEYG